MWTTENRQRYDRDRLLYPSDLTDDEWAQVERVRRFVNDAPTSAAEAAKIILDGVRADRLRILVGPDAHTIDRMVREDPDHAYDPEFYERFATEAGWYAGR